MRYGLGFWLVGFVALSFESWVMGVVFILVVFRLGDDFGWGFGFWSGLVGQFMRDTPNQTKTAANHRHSNEPQKTNRAQRSSARPSPARPSPARPNQKKQPHPQLPALCKPQRPAAPPHVCQCLEVARRLGHLLAVEQQVAVAPGGRGRRHCGRRALRGRGDVGGCGGAGVGGYGGRGGLKGRGAGGFLRGGAALWEGSRWVAEGPDRFGKV